MRLVVIGFGRSFENDSANGVGVRLAAVMGHRSWFPCAVYNAMQWTKTRASPRPWRAAPRWLRIHVHGLTLLNCFAYTCGFGLAGWLGGAARVANLDISRRYLDWGRDNAARNGLAPAATDLIFGDVFDWLRRFQRSGTTFDG